VKRTLGGIALLALFFVGGAGLIGGAVWSYLDEHSGVKTTAHVLSCTSSGSGKGSNLFCHGRWTRDGRTVTGSVYNARRGVVGKEVEVRLHGGHASRPQLLVSVALGIFGLITLGVGVVLVVAIIRARRRASAGALPDSYASA
jgi:hypothetical protein